MTRHRPSNRKPTGVNKSLGNSLANERDRNRKKHKIAATEDDLDNPAFMDEVRGSLFCSYKSCRLNFNFFYLVVGIEFLRYFFLYL